MKEHRRHAYSGKPETSNTEKQQKTFADEKALFIYKDHRFSILGRLINF